MIEPGESTLILTIAQAGADAGGGGEPWPAMLAALCSHMQADGAELRLAGAGWDMDGPIDRPMPAVLTGLRLNRVYTGEELADRMSHPDDPLAQAADCRAIGLRLTPGNGEGAVGWLLFIRRRGGFRAVDSAALARLAPHVAQALELASRIAGLQSRAAQAEGLLHRLGIGALYWDRQGRPAPRDAVARALLARLPGGLPEPPAGLSYRRLAGDIELVVLTAEDGRRSAVLRDGSRPLPGPETLAGALGIGLAEARLARALAQGASLPEAAAQLGVTVETARFYSRQIYARTGLRGQPELMRRIWSSALGLGLLPPG